MKKIICYVVLLCVPCATPAQAGEPQLIRESYFSEAVDAERDYRVYLPRDFSTRSSWPVMLFLHGDGERGDAKGELDFVLVHGPLYEAWVQKRDLPFVIIAPQLPMYGRGEIPYLRDRKAEDIPRRLATGTPERPDKFPSQAPMSGALGKTPDEFGAEGPPSGWNLHDAELIAMVDTVIEKYRGDRDRVYLTGISYGGFGRWFVAARHAERFAAAVPIAAYAHPDLAAPIAAAGMPVWCFAGGRDPVVPVEYFYPGLNELERLSPADLRFTVEEDMGHDVWKRAYARGDIYDWLLSHARTAAPDSSD